AEIGGRLCAGAKNLRQADLRASGDPAQARRDGNARPCRAAADARYGERLRPRRALRHGGRHGEILRQRSRAREFHRGHAHPRRLRLFARIRHRAALSRCPLDLHRRGHQRDAAHHHLQAIHQEESRRMKPLQGVRIVSVEQFGAAPYGTMFLADLGAEVIKIENAAIGGDPARKTGPYLLGTNDSEYFQGFNINKKSVAIDLRSAEGKAALNELAATADALINNLRGDLSAKMGLDYKSLSSVNPKLVCVHISAYGRDNERAFWPGYDYLMQAESGLMHLTGEPD